MMTVSNGRLDLHAFGAHLRARGITYALVGLVAAMLWLNARSMEQLIAAHDARDHDRIESMRVTSTAITALSTALTRLEADMREHANLDQLRFARFEKFCRPGQ